MEGRRLSGGHRSRRRWLASEIFIDQPRRRDHHLLLRSAAVPWRSSPEPPTTVDLLYRRFPCWLERERLSERERRKVSGCCAAMTFDDFVMEKSAAMARDFLELSRVFKNASQGVFDGQVSRQMREAVLLLVGVKQPPPSSGSDACNSSQPTFSQREDLFWSDAQNIRAVEVIQRAISERNEFMDMPSFSLGFTKEFNDGVHAVVDDIARDYGPVGDGMSHDMGVDMSHAIGEVGDAHAPGNMNASRGVDADCDSPVEGFCDENVGAGGGSGLTTSPVPPVVGGAETLLQAAGPEVDLAARNSVPLVSTPLEGSSKRG
nr:uncharacterized protein LOC109178682 isoform X2 [Ipomoea batatas]